MKENKNQQLDLSGFYRAKVIDNNDEKKFGRVKIWIPDLMPLVQDTKGLWARPATNILGGVNTEDDCNYYGTCFIPSTGSWVLIFFECNNINRPYYFSSLNLENTQTLPECRVGTEFYKKWVILKSTEGRTIVISDDPDDARVEITGKKRQITDPPSGDEDSVYTIDGNQTTILLDERSGKEKLLIRTYKGDFINIDIDDRKLEIEFNGDIKFKTSGTFCVQANKFNVKASSDVKIQSGTSTDIKAGGSANIEGSPVNIKSGGALNAEAGGKLNLKGGSGAALGGTGKVDINGTGLVAIDGSGVSEMGGDSSPPGSASSAGDASDCPVTGERDT